APGRGGELLLLGGGRRRGDRRVPASAAPGGAADAGRRRDRGPDGRTDRRGRPLRGVDSDRPAGGADGTGDAPAHRRDLHAAAGGARRHRAVRPPRRRDVGRVLHPQQRRRPDVLVVPRRRLLDARRGARRGRLPQDAATARRDRHPTAGLRAAAYDILPATMADPKDYAEIDDLLREDRTFPPPAGFRERAVVRDDSVYAEADRDPEAFWAKFAGELEWSRPWDRVLDWQPPHAQWFVGGTLNVCVNCV